MRRFLIAILFCAFLLSFSTGCAGRKETDPAQSSEPETEPFVKEVIKGEITGIQYEKQFLGYQDGAIYGDYIFNFRTTGVGYVHRFSTREYLGEFKIPGTLRPHVNSASFSNSFVEETDEFPLLYLNVYNNYMGQNDPKWGIVMAYRILRDKNRFTLNLWQVIRVSFAYTDLWADKTDRLPYGNFVIDTDRNRLIAFNIRDSLHCTRFFEFALPDVNAGSYRPLDKCKEVDLRKEDILNQFDVEHALVLQGACYRDGRVYSAEGMGNEEYPAQIRVIDLESQSLVQTFVIQESEDLIPLEAEFIDFYQNTLYYGDVRAQLYRMTIQ